METSKQDPSSISSSSLLDWTRDDVFDWLASINMEHYTDCFKRHSIDGATLLLMTENDLRNPPLSLQCLGDIKRLTLALRSLQAENKTLLRNLGYTPMQDQDSDENTLPDLYPLGLDFEEGIADVRATKLNPDLWKALVSLIYLFIVSWVTAFTMVIVHHRVPDMKKYPPLPDIFLDNIPYIPWAFAMCEFTGSLMFCIWVTILIFHKHRFILVRRFFSLTGTVFLLRCVTMMITSLSVPGTHVQCSPMIEEFRQENDSAIIRMQSAYFIWRGAGMSIQGVRTCGDYMFSGHTAALTMLNFFITEYTPRHLYFMHSFSWILNMFGIFFILAAHEHYSIDVFIAFYITSRLFLYYHALANNQSLMQRDSNRTKIWFPLFSFFESDIDGIVPNEYDTPTIIMNNTITWLVNLKCRRVSGRDSVFQERRGSKEHQRRHIKYKVQNNKVYLNKVLKEDSDTVDM